jgi:hypothetical protein
MTASQKQLFSHVYEWALGAVVARLLCNIVFHMHEVKGSNPLVSILLLNSMLVVMTFYFATTLMPAVLSSQFCFIMQRFPFRLPFFTLL